MLQLAVRKLKDKMRIWFNLRINKEINNKILIKKYTATGSEPLDFGRRIHEGIVTQ